MEDCVHKGIHWALLKTGALTMHCGKCGKIIVMDDHYLPELTLKALYYTMYYTMYCIATYTLPDTFLD